MRITVLAENTACREGMLAQHGMSLYIEANGQKILFDMGQDDTFVQNAKVLGIDLSMVDLAVISHGHYDHGGGLAHFLQSNAHAPIYIHKLAFGPYYNGTEKYIGLDSALQDHPRLRFVEGFESLPGEMVLYDCNDRGWVSESWGLTRKCEDSFQPDVFDHEQYLQITEGDRRYLISGCSHKGILNIAASIAPDVLIGGFHLSKQEDTSALQYIAQRLLAQKTVYYTGHCTGSSQYGFLKSIMGDQLHSISTGKVIEL